MANNKNFLAMLIMVLVFGMAVVGCDNDSTGGDNDKSLDGYWRGNSTSAIYIINIEDNDIYIETRSGSGYVDGVIIYKAPNFTILTEEGRTIRGTYKLDADTLVISTTDSRYLYLNGWYYKLVF